MSRIKVGDIVEYNWNEHKGFAVVLDSKVDPKSVGFGAYHVPLTWIVAPPFYCEDTSGGGDCWCDLTALTKVSHVD